MNNRFLPQDPPAKLKGHARDLHLLIQQQKWIEYCESGCSYDGPNGAAIRKADYDELARLEDRAMASQR